MPAPVQHSHHILSSTLMASSTNSFFRLCLFISLALAETHAATFYITNNCPFTVWAAAFPVGGGRRLDQGQNWSINVSSNATGRIWGRTNCTFDETGRGHCQTGDCDGLLDCKAYGTPPNTLAEYALKQVNDQDFFDISLVDGFNVAMEFTPTTGNCSGPKCTADINQQCPTALKAPGGCNNPCTVFKTNEYCCTSGKCNITTYATFFIRMCRDAYSYPLDDQSTTFTCPSGTNYRVAFCPCSCSWFDEMADYVAGDGTSYKVTVSQSE